MTLSEIEDKFQVQDIKVNDIAIWPYLRIYLGDKIHFKQDRTIKFNRSILGLFFKSVLYGISNYFKKFDYLYFTSTEQRKWINGKYTDRGDYLEEIIPKGLCIELPVPGHVAKSKIGSHNIASRFPLILFSQILQLFIKPRWQGESIIKEILQAQSHQIDYKKLAKRFLAERRVMKSFIKKCSLKMVFLTAPYNAMGYVYACHELEVKVVEFQHGIINRAHYAYNVPLEINQMCYPDYLLSFGSNVNEIFANNNHYIKEDNILAVGSFYIDYVSGNVVENKMVQELKSKYDKLIVVTLQDGYEDLMLPFLKEATDKCSEFGFLFVPRHKSAEDYDAYKLPENVRFIKDLDAYQSMALGDIHTTLNSTCAIESPSLGTMNVLLNLDNLARKYLDKLLDENHTTFYANTVDEYCELVRNLSFKNKAEIISSNNGNIQENYQENLKKAIAAIVND